MRPNMSAPPATLALRVRDSAEIPARPAAVSKAAIALAASLSLCARCSSMNEAGTAPRIVGGMIGS